MSPEYTVQNEILLLKHTLQKMGAWNEYVVEKMRFHTGSSTKTSHNLYKVMASSMGFMFDFNGPGCSLQKFNYVHISFSWSDTLRPQLWSLVFSRLPTTPIKKHINKIKGLAVKKRCGVYVFNFIIF